MDYNLLYNQSGSATKGDPAKLPGWRAADARRPTSRASSGPTTATARRSSSATTSSSGTAASTWTPSRRPCRDVCHRTDVRCVSFQQLADWLDAQDPPSWRSCGACRSVPHLPAAGVLPRLRPTRRWRCSTFRQAPGQLLVDRRRTAGGHQPARGVQHAGDGCPRRRVGPADTGRGRVLRRRVAADLQPGGVGRLLDHDAGRDRHRRAEHLVQHRRLHLLLLRHDRDHARHGTGRARRGLLTPWHATPTASR